MKTLKRLVLFPEPSISDPEHLIQFSVLFDDGSVVSFSNESIRRILGVAHWIARKIALRELAKATSR